MPLSHVCLGCGRDLARIRVARDPATALPLVVCPGCGTAAVRRRHPLVQRYRQWRRLRASLCCLGLQLVLILYLAAAHLQIVRELLVMQWSRVERLQLVASLTVLVIVGTWLTAGLAHWRRAAAFAGWAALLALLLLLDQLDDDRPLDLVRWSEELAALVTTLVVALAGVPLGNGVTRSCRRWSRWRWRQRLARMRMRRTS